MEKIPNSLLLLLILTLLRAPFARSQEIVTGFTLVNADTDQDIETLGDIVDISQINDSITIRVDVNDTQNAIEYIVVDYNDGFTQRRDGMPPYYLGGDTDGDAHGVNALRTPGFHVVKATAYQGSIVLSELSHSFLVLDSADATPGSGNETAATSSDVDPYPYSSSGTVSGELKKWHKITIGFSGRLTSERNNVIHPFLNYLLEVEFTHPETSTKYVVPGYFACDGDAANSGAQSGNAYLVHFRPDQVGRWEWNAIFLEGPNVAVDKTIGKSAAFFDGAWGSFDVAESDKVAPDLRAKGRLQYVGKRYLQFSETGEYFIKAGADSPENLLAYEDFDNTPNINNRRKSWGPHVEDYEEGDPTWSDGKGKGLIGAINYLASTGANVFSFLPMNIGGDDKNVFPYVTDTEFDRIDCSKTAQWDIVFDHASSKGMFLHFKTQERENDHLLDGGDLGINRKLYYRELIARFGHHLALNWNLGEENTNSDDQRKSFSDYIKEIDPYNHPIVMHTWPGEYAKHYTPLLGHPTFDGVSLQADPAKGYRLTAEWAAKSSAAGRNWIVAFDEQGPATKGVVPDSVDPTHDSIRKNVLWGNLMAGGWGVEYYFGYEHPNSDLTCEDFRSRANMWAQSKIALDFFEQIPFWEMAPDGEVIGIKDWGPWALSSKKEAELVLFLPSGGNGTLINMSVMPAGNYTVQWYDPRLGGNLQNGSVLSVESTESVSIGNPPYGFDEDWAIHVQCTDCIVPTTAPFKAPTNAPTSAPVAQTSSPALNLTDAPTSAPAPQTSFPTKTSAPPPTNTPTNSPMVAPVVSPSPTTAPVDVVVQITEPPSIIPSTLPPTLPPVAQQSGAHNTLMGVGLPAFSVVVALLLM